MKFKNIDLAYRISSIEERNRIFTALSNMGFKKAAGNNNFNVNNILMVHSSRKTYQLYSETFQCDVVNSFEEWCEKCIEGYVKEPIKTNPFKVGDKVKFVKISDKIYRYSSTYIKTARLVIGEIYTVSKCETTEEWGRRISVEESPNKYMIGVDCFELYQEETPKTNNPVQETKGYRKVGDKHIFEEGYTGEHPFKVGQVVLIHEGCNIGSKEFKGVIKEVNPKFASTRLLIHTDKLQDGSGRYSQSYPDKFENRRLIVTILSEQETKPSITHTESKSNVGKWLYCVDASGKNPPILGEKYLIEKESDNYYTIKCNNGMYIDYYKTRFSEHPLPETSSSRIDRLRNSSDGIWDKKQYHNFPLTPEEFYKKKDKKDLSLLKEPNEIKIVVKTKNKKHKPNLSIIKN